MVTTTSANTTSSAAWGALLSGAALWGTVGLFIAPLRELGFSTFDIAVLRMGASFLMMVPFVLWWRPSVFRLKRFRDIGYFIFTGMISLGIFQWCYLSAIQHVGMSLAVVLLYTAPAMVVVMARFVFKEAITPVKVVAIVLMIGGCVLVLELPSEMRGSLSLTGVLFGLGAAFSFALYNISSKLALQEYSVTTVTLYTFLFASIGLIPFSSAFTETVSDISIDLAAFGWIFGMVLFTSVLAYGLYISGLQRVESGRATVAAVMEVVSAVTLGVLLTGDRFSVMSAIGLFLVISAVVLISISKGRFAPNDGC